MFIKLFHLAERKNIVFIIVYMLFLLDNVLLTVVVPIIPDYLFSNLLNYTYTAKYGPASLSPLQRKYETLESDNGPLGALLASKAFVQLAFTPFIGYLTQVLDSNIPLLVGSCSLFIASILFAYGNSYEILVTARALHGSASAAIAVSGMCILAEHVPKESRNKFMPLAFGGIALGVLIGYPLGGAAYQLLGKIVPFLFIAFLILISIVLQLGLLTTESMDLHTSANPNSTYVQWVELLKNKVIVISGLSICISTSSMAILEPCVPMWLLTHMHPRPSKWQLGAVFIPDSVGYFIGSHFAGLISVEPWRISISAMVVAGLSCIYLPEANSMAQLSIPHFGLGLGVGAVDASLVPLLANFVDNQGSTQYGPVYAFQQAAVAVAYSFGPLLGGQAVQIFGFPWLMRLVGFVNLMFCPFLLELENRDEQKRPVITGYMPSYSTLDSLNSFSQENE
ncbi:synaptic vesicular amine transporter-like [Anthonomus grandis grandis]|uniref:synaptic vesicular amine transporter-like n=1 Tax=Anthonomus grandis grandis TaxID=2921223 RepID=UPI00216613B1|nr:synaptic vesicular amine transporter-like [Anthonomus grandis grandis]